MSNIAIGDTAVAGFRMLRARPVTLVYWFGMALALGAGALALNLWVTRSFMADLSAVASGGPTAQAQSLTASMRMLGVFGLMIPVYLAWAAVLSTAANRAILEPERSAVGYLRLGAEELRTLVVLIVIGALLMVAYVALVFVLVIVAGVGAVAGAASGNSLAGGVGMILLFLLLVPAILIALLYLATRLSLALPQTFATKSINIFGSWRLTKGRSGRLFLAYLLAFLIYLGLSIVNFAVSLAFGGASAMAALRAAANSSAPSPDLQALMPQFGAGMVIAVVVSSLITALGLAVTLCPAAEAYRQISRDAHPEDVFA